MLVVSIILLVLSFLYLVFVFRCKRMNLASTYAIYVLFAIVYSLFPILTYYGIEPKIWFEHWTLNESEILITTQVLLFSACNTTFAFVFHVRYKTPPSASNSPQKPLACTQKNMLFFAYIILSAMLIALGHRFSYTSGRGELVHSLISNAKVILAAIYIVFMVRYGTGIHLAIMLLAFVGLVLVEHSRWYFISVLFATMLYMQNTGRVTNKRIMLFGSGFLVLLLYVGLYRCNVEFKTFTLLFNPLYIEGDYGSYMILQTHDLILGHKICFYTLFSDYLIDPIVYLIPRPLFVGFGLDKDSLGMFGQFVSIHQKYLTETYAPMGGFHYIAQASSALPFVGPLIVTYLFARLTVAIERYRSGSKLKSLVYYLYGSGFMFVFMKTRFDMTVKYFLTLAVPACILFFLLRGDRNET